MAERPRVLVVEDDAQVRAVFRRVLDRDCDVTTASDGPLALELLRGGARFDTILCDVNLASMGGLELREVIAAEFPDQVDAIVFVTGGLDDPAWAAALAILPHRVLAKPFTREALREVIIKRS